MPPSIQIQVLGRGDVALLRALNARFCIDFDDRAAYADAPPGDAWLAALLARDTFIAIVAREDNAVLGGLCAYVLPKFEQARSEVYIYDLSVAAGHRRRGIATAMVRALQGEAAARGAWVVYVQADHGDDPAIALYSRLGVREDVLHFDLPVPAR